MELSFEEGAIEMQNDRLAVGTRGWLGAGGERTQQLDGARLIQCAVFPQCRLAGDGGEDGVGVIVGLQA